MHRKSGDVRRKEGRYAARGGEPAGHHITPTTELFPYTGGPHIDINISTEIRASSARTTVDQGHPAACRPYSHARSTFDGSPIESLLKFMNKFRRMNAHENRNWIAKSGRLDLLAHAAASANDGLAHAPQCAVQSWRGWSSDRTLVPRNLCGRC